MCIFLILARLPRRTKTQNPNSGETVGVFLTRGPVPADPWYYCNIQGVDHWPFVPSSAFPCVGAQYYGLAKSPWGSSIWFFNMIISHILILVKNPAKSWKSKAMFLTISSTCGPIRSIYVSLGRSQNTKRRCKIMHIIVFADLFLILCLICLISSCCSPFWSSLIN